MLGHAHMPVTYVPTGTQRPDQYSWMNLTPFCSLTSCTLARIRTHTHALTHPRSHARSHAPRTHARLRATRTRGRFLATREACVQMSTPVSEQPAGSPVFLATRESTGQTSTPV